MLALGFALSWAHADLVCSACTIELLVIAVAAVTTV